MPLHDNNMMNDDDGTTRIEKNHHDHCCSDRNDVVVSNNDDTSSSSHFQILNDIDSIIELTINNVVEDDSGLTYDDGCSNTMSSGDAATSSSTRTISYAFAGIPKDYYSQEDHTDSKELGDELKKKHNQIKGYIDSTKHNKRIWILFYPAGFNCRMLLLFHRYAIQYNVIILCVNRPGKYGTSKSNILVPSTTANTFDSMNCIQSSMSCIPQQEQEKLEYSIAQLHIQTAVCDVIHVIDYYNIQLIDGIFCMCAGCPFGMKLVCQYPKRLSSIFKFVSGAGWVLPADCGWYHSSTFYSLGTIVPYSISSAVFVNMQKCMRSLMKLIPKHQLQELFKAQLSSDELIVFETELGQKLDNIHVKYALPITTTGLEKDGIIRSEVEYVDAIENLNDDIAIKSLSSTNDDSQQIIQITVLAECMEWMHHRKDDTIIMDKRSTTTSTTIDSDYADSCDITVLMSSSTHLGINYQTFQSNILNSYCNERSTSNNDGVSSTLHNNNNIDHINNNNSTDEIIRILWFHGTDDQTVPYNSAKWFIKNLGTKATTLIELQDGSHQGVLLLLHPDIMNLAFIQ